MKPLKIGTDMLVMEYLTVGYLLSPRFNILLTSSAEFCNPMQYDRDARPNTAVMP